MIIKSVDKYNVQLIIDSSMYSGDVIHKCLYWYGRNLVVDIEREAGAFLVTLFDSSGKMNMEDIAARIRIDLLDFKTREIIIKETKDIRAMLIAKAFANDDAFDEDPSGTIRDSLGFDPSEF